MKMVEQKLQHSIRILTLSAVAAATIVDRRCFGIGPDDLIFPGTKNNLLISIQCQ
ncbi:MAG: hypothetical protein ACLVAV_02675 [Clostridium sp.]